MQQEQADHWAQRERELSSAGKATQQLPLPPELQQPAYPPPASPMAPVQQPAAPASRAALPWVLIGIGAVLLISRMASGVFANVDIEGSFFFALISSVFLFFSFWKRNYGLLIPGCILAGFSAGILFAESLGGAPFFFGMMLGFLAIIPLGRVLMGVRQNWPIFPAMAMLAVGLMAAVSSAPTMLALPFFAVPLLLIGAGLFLGSRRRSL